MMDHLRRLGSRFTIKLRPDSDGFIGRECPNRECRRYFKITNGTGLTGEDLPCHCPYCGHATSQEEFATQEQIEFGTSIVKRQVVDAVVKDLKRSEFDIRGPMGMEFSMRVKSGPPAPIRHYRENKLETTVVCDHCTLRYAIYGVFAFCPDCGRHNSHQMLDKNLEVVTKKIDWAAAADTELAKSLHEDALANVVAAFDGFGREVCRVHARTAHDPAKANNISFQNLEGSRKRVQSLFDFDLAHRLDANDWQFAHRCFQKRHLFAHTMGVIDEEYVAKTTDPHAVVGRRITVTGEEVSKLVGVVRQLGQFLVSELGSKDEA